MSVQIVLCGLLALRWEAKAQSQEAASVLWISASLHCTPVGQVPPVAVPPADGVIGLPVQLERVLSLAHLVWATNVHQSQNQLSSLLHTMHWRKYRPGSSQPTIVFLKQRRPHSGQGPKSHTTSLHVVVERKSPVLASRGWLRSVRRSAIALCDVVAHASF